MFKKTYTRKKLCNKIISGKFILKLLEIVIIITATSSMHNLALYGYPNGFFLQVLWSVSQLFDG